MHTAFRNCKVCGSQYPYCKTVVRDGVFRWQDVACCEEHGSIYLARVLASREVVQTHGAVEDQKEIFVDDFSDLIDDDDDEEDEFFEEDFEDDDDDDE